MNRLRGPAALATQLGRLFVVAGAVLLGVGWNAAASRVHLPAQFPYLLSSTLPGLALVVTGAGLEVVQTVRTLSARRAAEMAHATAFVTQLTERLGGGTVTAHGRVVATRTSYHSPACPTVVARSDLPGLPLEEARRTGLAPCRRCRS